MLVYKCYTLLKDGDVMYLYKYTYEEHTKELITEEMKALFDNITNNDFIVSNLDVNPNRSYHINYRIDIKASSNKLDVLVEKVKECKLYFEQFKVEFIDVDSSVVDYKQRLSYCRAFGDVVGGTVNIKKPAIKLVVTYLDDLWYFGILEENDRSFERLQTKVHTYSHAMSCELSRTVVNIACGNGLPKLIDPCSGIGTVLAEAYDMGFDIEGTEYNWLVFDKARTNLKELGMPCLVSKQDMHTIEKQYDVSILDIPYGLMSKTSEELQHGLINKCYHFSDKLVLVANEDSNHLIEKTKWKTELKIDVPKANYKFTRFIYVLVK